jgi:hypothetical protein
MELKNRVGKVDVGVEVQAEAAQATVTTTVGPKV